jgi:hypothetical protein
MAEIPEMPEELPLADEAVVIAEATTSAHRGETPERGEIAHIPETAKEEMPVIDVHAPHGGVHTWKDFWIHLGTITLGLLIAISLEQSVEYFHQLNQRHQLEADLQAEGVENHALAEVDWRVMDDRMAATAARLREVESALAARRKMDPPFPASSFTPPTSSSVFVVPLSAVWTTAKEGASIDLLPREVARSYTRLYFQADRVQQLAFDSDAGGNEVTAYECRFSDGTLPCKPVLSQMSDEQLGEYSGLLTRYFTLLQVEKARVLIFEFRNDHLLQGLELPQGGVGTLSNYRAQHPDTFLRPLPEAK